MPWIARLGVIAAIAGSIGWGVTAPASASTGTLGQRVYQCAQVMLPYYISPGGSITMTMPDGTVMQFATFGAMVTYMQSQPMCS